MRFIILIFLLVSTIFSGDSSYIKITKTSSKSSLLALNSKFNGIGVPIKYNYTGSTYLIFSGPYEDYESAQEGLRKIKNYFPAAFIVESTQKSANKDSFFMAFDLSYNNSISNHVGVGGSVVAKIPDEDFFGFGLDAGYKLENGVFFTLGYAHILNNDIVMDNIYLTLNYEFQTYYNLSPYVGVLLGNSYLKWNTLPLEQLTYFDDKSTSLLSGAQFGVNYAVDSDISLSLGYRLLLMNHISRLEAVTGNSEIHHKRLDNLLLGIKYNF